MGLRRSRYAMGELVITLNRNSTEFVRFLVKARVEGQKYDPTTDVLKFSFPVKGSQPSSWVDGEWETAGKDHYAMALVGPGGTPLTAGDYDVYIKITDTPEIPVRHLEILRIT